MTGSTTLCIAEPGSQPLRSPKARCPSELSSSAALAAKRWQATHHRSPYPQIESAEAKREAFETALPRSLADRLKALAFEHGDLAAFLDDLASATRFESGGDVDLGDSDCEAFAAGLPLEPDAASLAPQPHMQALMHDFRRRQRQASLLVAGCVATSLVLTAVGIAALASFARPAPAAAEPLASNSTSVVWRKPQADIAPVRLTLVSTAPDEARKSEPLLVPARAEAAIVATPLPTGTTPQASGDATPKLILVTANRPLALSPLLSQRQARYVLVRGLPTEAALSAGQRNPSGAWLVKDKDLGQLTLSMAAAASGDYPVEIYALGTSRDAPQARQRLVFRVAPAGPVAALDTSAGQALVDMALASASPPEGVVTADTSVLMARAMRLLDEGDIASARLLFLHLADQGESDAAYELGRTFDAQALTELGARGMGADRTRAVSWYERASETGSIKAAERLKTLASLSD
jgi:hypothetical protein